MSRNENAMKSRFLTLWGKIVAAIVSVFGLYGCDIHAVDYGCPYAEFTMKGTVTTEENTPVKDIKVAVEVWSVAGNDKRQMYEKTTYTDADGNVSINTGFVYAPDSVSVKIDDIDGEANGGDFQSQVLSPEIVKTKEADGEWFEGSYESTFDAKLQKK